LGGDYDFTRYIGNVRTHHELSPRLILDTRLVAGATGGRPPYFKRFFLGGAGTLRGYDAKQFDGTDMAVFTLETSYLLPSRYLPSVIPFYEGGRTWGEAANPAEKWRSALGLGLRWPTRGTSFFVRFDAAWPLDTQPGQDKKAQFYWRIGIPF
jgi:outer membrane protein insertion porin family